MKFFMWKGTKLSFDNVNDHGCVNPIERMALQDVFAEQREAAKAFEKEQRLEAKALMFSTRFREASKLVSGLDSNRKIKLVLIQKVYHDSLDEAISRYMRKEELPNCYFEIVKKQDCIERIIEGIFYKVCNLPVSEKLSQRVHDLGNELRCNIGQQTAYDRVACIQQFIHQTIDKYVGVGTARSIPVLPMKNALSVARLNLGVLDVSSNRTGYIEYIDSLSYAKALLEYDEPRQQTFQSGKKTWLRWRVRHLRPISYYFSMESRERLCSLRNLNELVPTSQFIQDAIHLYADSK